MTDKQMLPNEMPDPVHQVLSMMNFQTGPIAHAYRAGGHDIPTRCEDEQAFVLYRFMKIALEHGDDWRDVVTSELEQMRDAAAKKKADAA